MRVLIPVTRRAVSAVTRPPFLNVPLKSASIIFYKHIANSKMSLLLFIRIVREASKFAVLWFPDLSGG